MNRRLGRRLLGTFTGGLAGYIHGWIWGWSLFEPNSDVWALAALVGALIGLVTGALPAFWQFAEIPIGATLGLYLGWVARTWLCGDQPGDCGVAVMIAGLAAGGAIGVKRDSRHREKRLGVLLGALYAGLFGGFLIDVVILDLVAGLVREHTILGQAPGVILCSVLGGLAGGWVGGSMSAATKLVDPAAD